MPVCRERARIAVAAVVAAGLTGSAELGGVVERWADPVIVASEAGDIQRSADLACWTWSFVKRRKARLDAVDLDLWTDERDRIDAVALVNDPDGGLRYFRSGATSPASRSRLARRICVDLARARVPSGAAITARLTMTYTARPGLWRTRYEIPPVRIDAP